MWLGVPGSGDPRGHAEHIPSRVRGSTGKSDGPEGQAVNRATWKDTRSYATL